MICPVRVLGHIGDGRHFGDPRRLNPRQHTAVAIVRVQEFTSVSVSVSSRRAMRAAQIAGS